MAFSLIADQAFPSIFDIDGRALAKQGITLLLADLDNTLAKYGQPSPDEAVVDWKDGLQAAGVDLFLLSNSRKPARPRHFAEVLRIPYLGHAGKPGKEGFVRAMERMGRTPDQTAMVGDQLFTDILGARRAGVLALLVEPIELKGNPGRYLRYGVERPFRSIAKRRTKPI